MKEIDLIQEWDNLKANEIIKKILINYSNLTKSAINKLLRITLEKVK